MGLQKYMPSKNKKISNNNSWAMAVFICYISV